MKFRLTNPVIASVVLALFGGVALKYSSDINAAKKQYVADSRRAAQAKVAATEHVFNQIYQGLRTMARLPGVRSIDRYAQTFDANAKGAVQEIYNNLASNVSMSEVYIVPASLEPERKDPKTGQLEAPILTFDEMILGPKAASVAHEEEEGPELEEVEIFEYRLMKQQLATFKADYPRLNKIKGLEFPALSGPQVVTCDNSRYDIQTKDDADRSGLVYSVPFYGPDGVLKGCMSGVVLTNALRDILKSGEYGLVCTDHDYFAPGTEKGLSWTDKSAAKGKPNSNLIFSQALPVKFPDNSAHWVLWAGKPDSAFWASPAAQTAKQIRLAGWAAVALIGFALWRFRKSGERHEKAVADLAVAVNHLAQGNIGAASSQGGTHDAGEIAEAIGRVVEYQTDLGSVAKRLAEGDLTARFDPRCTDDTLGHSFNAMAESLSNVVSSIVTESERVQESTSSLVHAIEQSGISIQGIAESTSVVACTAKESSNVSSKVAEGSELLAHTANETAASMDAFDREISTVQMSSDQQAVAVNQAGSVAKEGHASVTVAIQSMQRIHDQVEKSSELVTGLGESTDQIGSIIASINDIASQTNLLALNAAIEAARAGEHGRGFAVVADEVRKLAEKSSSATEDISVLLSKIQEGVQQSVDAMRRSQTEVGEGAQASQHAGAALAEILEAIEHVEDAAKTNHGAIHRLVEVSQSVSKGIKVVEAHSQDSAAAAEELTASAQEVSHHISGISDSVQEQSRNLQAMDSVVAHLKESTRNLLALTERFEMETLASPRRAA